MATTVFKIKIDARGGTQKVGSIKDLVEKEKDYIKKQSLEEARYLGNKIFNYYKNYLMSNKYLSIADDDQRMTLVVNERKDGGYNINLSGKNLLYYEYGTGSRGLKDPHPKKELNLQPYGSGRDIIHYAKRNNGHFLPKWYPFYKNGRVATDKKLDYIDSAYKTDFGSIRNLQISDYVWRTHGIITKGAPAGKFIYNSMNDYRNEFNKSNDKSRLSKKSISIHLKSNISDILRK